MSNQTILLVDDDVTLSEMYKERLGVEGFKVETASDGEEALKKAKELKPDLILLDIMMPKINGLDVLKQLRDDMITQKIPVFLLTALVQEPNKMQEVTKLAQGYIVKSEAMPKDVIEKIKSVLQNKPSV